MEQNKPANKKLASVDTSKKKRSHGTSCLVCRKRKIKCDTTKPVCLACVKHNCSMDCTYSPSKTGVTSANIANIDTNISTATSSIIRSNTPDIIKNNSNSNIMPMNGHNNILTTMTTGINPTLLPHSYAMNKHTRGGQLYSQERETVFNERLHHETQNKNNNNHSSSLDKSIMFQNKETTQQKNKKPTTYKKNIKIANDINAHNIQQLTTDSSFSLVGGKYNELSFKVRKTVRKQKMVKEFSELKKKLESLENLLEGCIKEEEYEIENPQLLSNNSMSLSPENIQQNNQNQMLYENSPNYSQLRFIPKLSFWDGFEQVNVLSARLVFLGPLSSSTIIKKDSFCAVLNSMINKTREDIARALEVQTEEKYKGLRVTAKHMTEQVNIHIKPQRKVIYNKISQPVLLENNTKDSNNTTHTTTSKDDEDEVEDKNNNAFNIITPNNSGINDNVFSTRNNNKAAPGISLKRTFSATKSKEKALENDYSDLDNLRVGSDKANIEFQNENTNSNISKKDRTENDKHEESNSGSLETVSDPTNIENINQGLERNSNSSVKPSKKFKSTSLVENTKLMEKNSKIEARNYTEQDNDQYEHSKKNTLNISEERTRSIPEDEDEVEEVFEQKYLENEGLDEMDTIVQEGKIANNPLSVENLLNKKVSNSSSDFRSNSTGNLSALSQTITSATTDDTHSEHLSPEQLLENRNRLLFTRNKSMSSLTDFGTMNKFKNGHKNDHSKPLLSHSEDNALSFTSNNKNQSNVTASSQSNNALEGASNEDEQGNTGVLNNVTKSQFESDNSQPKLKPEDDIHLWRTLDTVLTNIQQQNSTQERIPEGLFGQQGDTKGRQELLVLMRIRSILPSAKLIRMHLENYFKSPIHGLFPILNEDWFRDTMQTVIGGIDKNLNQQPKINATRRFDLAKLGSLLVILRLSYLQCPETLAQCQTDNERYMFSHPISNEFVDTAQMCLNLFKMLRKGVLPVLHCALLLRVLRKFAPEDGDIVDGADSETFTGLLVKISTSIGLNTDVGRSQWAQEQPMYIDQWRKCWYVVYHFDFMEAVNMGNTLSIDVDTFDTKLPEFKLDPHTGVYPTYILDPQLEDVIVSNTQKNFQMSLICRELLAAITNKRQKFSILELQKSIDKLDMFIRSEYGPDMKTIIDIPTNDLPSSVAKLNCFKNFIDINSLIFMVYLHIFIHIDKNIVSSLSSIENEDLMEENMELFHYYLKKVISLYIEMEPVLVLCYESRKKNSEKIEEIFGKRTKLLVIQSCEYVLTRFTQGLYLVISRTLHFNYNFMMSKDDELKTPEKQDMKEISDMVTKIIRCSMEKLSHSNSICKLLGQKYFQIWRISKSSNFMYQLLNNDKNNLFDKSSKINMEHRLENNDHLGTFPFQFIPHINLFDHYKLIHFQEIFSTLSSVKWNIFEKYLSESEINEARDFRHNANKSFQKNIRKTKKSLNNRTVNKNLKQKQLKNAKKNQKNSTDEKTLFESNKIDDAVSSSNLEGSNVSSTPSREQVEIPIEEIDKFWYDTVISHSNNFGTMPDRLQANAPTLGANNPYSGNIPLMNKPEHQIGTYSEDAAINYKLPDVSAEQNTNIFANNIMSPHPPAANISNANNDLGNTLIPLDNSVTSNLGFDDLFNDKDMLKAQVFQKLQELERLNNQTNNTNPGATGYNSTNNQSKMTNFGNYYNHDNTLSSNFAVKPNRMTGHNSTYTSAGINNISSNTQPNINQYSTQNNHGINVYHAHSSHKDGSGLSTENSGLSLSHSDDNGKIDTQIMGEANASNDNQQEEHDPVMDIMKLQEMFNTDFLFPGSNSYYSDEVNF